MRSLLPNVDARKWILQENATGGDSVVWTWIRIDSEGEAEIRCGLRGSVNGVPTRSGTCTSLDRNATRIPTSAKTKNVAVSAPASSSNLPRLQTRAFSGIEHGSYHFQAAHAKACALRRPERVVATRRSVCDDATPCMRRPDFLERRL